MKKIDIGNFTAFPSEINIYIYVSRSSKSRF